jgi:hypothetical protein
MHSLDNGSFPPGLRQCGGERASGLTRADYNGIVLRCHLFSPPGLFVSYSVTLILSHYYLLYSTIAKEEHLPLFREHE